MTDWNLLAEAVYSGVDMTGTCPIEVDDLCDDICCLCGRDEEQFRLIDGRVVCMPCRAIGDLK